MSEQERTLGTGPVLEDEAGGSTARRGRPLDRSLDAVIYKATLELLKECGYDRLTMDMVASRARKGKGTLYRRWPSKGNLVAAAIASMKREIACPDTGSLRGDLEQLLSATHSAADDEFMTSVMGALSTAIRYDDDLATAFREQFVLPRRRVLRQVLERAAARGEIPPGRDVALLAEVLPGLVHSQALITCRPPDREFLRRIMAEVLYPLAIAPVPELGID